MFTLVRWSVTGVSDHGDRVCSKSGVILLAFRHSAGRLCFLLLEDHLVAATPRQGRRHSASAAGRRSINFCRCLKRSIKAPEQDAEERHQDNDHHHFMLHCLLAAYPVHARRPVLRPESVHFCDLVLRLRSDGSRQLLCPSVHLCYIHVPVSESQVRWRAPSTGV